MILPCQLRSDDRASSVDVGKRRGYFTTARGTTPVELTIREDGSYASVPYTAGWV